MVNWWEPALRKWTAGLDVSYCTVSADRLPIEGLETSMTREPSWWVADGSSFLRLDSKQVLQITPPLPTNEFHEALGWTLRELRRSYKEIQEDNIKTWFEALVTGESTQRLPEEDMVKSLGKRLPGYFVWFHPDHEKPIHAELRNLIQTTIEEAWPSTWLEWIQPTNSLSKSSLLMFLTLRESDMESALEDEDPSVGSPQWREALFMDEIVQGLLSQLESDVFITGTAYIGKRVAEWKDVEGCLSSVVQVWSNSGYLLRNKRVFSFAHMAVPLLLGGVSTDHRTAFADSARLRVLQQPSWNGELLETLHGMVSANLNVSEAARLLYLHRNTLLHRIERIREATGYDIRHFEDVMTLVLWSGIERGVDSKAHNRNERTKL